MSLDQVSLLKDLSEAFGPSGYEDEVRELILDLVKPLVDEVTTDRMGNLIATRRGGRDDVVMLDAHMDEVGFIVSFIEKDGFLRLAPLGGWDARVLPSHAVTVLTKDSSRVRGVVGTAPPHVLTDDDRKRAIKIEELFVDVGAASADGISDMDIDIGSPIVPSYPFEHVDDDLVMGKAFDDRAGCTVAISVLDALQGSDLDLTLAVAFTTSEEVGLRGARAAANQISPTVALALEGTTAVDVPGISGARRLASMGKGPAITIMDRSVITSRDVTALLESVAAREAIPYQRKLPGGGGTDVGAFQSHGSGVLCGVVSVPCRYIHTPLSLLRPSDLEATVKLTTGFVREAGSLVS